MRWTQEEYEQYLRKRAEWEYRYVSKHNQTDPEGLHSQHSQPTEGGALVCPLPRKGKSRKGAVLDIARRRIVFRVYSVRPADYDGYDIKALQDCLVKSGLLDGDEWNILSGEVISEKAYTAEEVRTEVEIT